MSEFGVDSRHNADEIVDSVTELSQEINLHTEVKTCDKCRQPVRLFEEEVTVVCTSTGGWSGVTLYTELLSVTCPEHAPTPEDAIDKNRDLITGIFVNNAAVATLRLNDSNQIEVVTLDYAERGL